MFILTREVDKNGRLVVLKPLRKRYCIDTGDIVQFIPTPDGLLLKGCSDEQKQTGTHGFVVTDKSE